MKSVSRVLVIADDGTVLFERSHMAGYGDGKQYRSTICPSYLLDGTQAAILAALMDAAKLAASQFSSLSNRKIADHLEADASAVIV